MLRTQLYGIIAPNAKCYLRLKVQLISAVGLLQLPAWCLLPTKMFTKMMLNLRSIRKISTHPFMSMVETQVSVLQLPRSSQKETAKLFSNIYDIFLSAYTSHGNRNGIFISLWRLKSFMRRTKWISDFGNKNCIFGINIKFEMIFLFLPRPVEI